MQNISLNIIKYIIVIEKSYNIPFSHHKNMHITNKRWSKTDLLPWVCTLPAAFPRHSWRRGPPLHVEQEITPSPQVGPQLPINMHNKLISPRTEVIYYNGIRKLIYKVNITNNIYKSNSFLENLAIDPRQLKNSTQIDLRI